VGHPEEAGAAVHDDPDEALRAAHRLAGVDGHAYRDDRADAQANGALALAKQLGRNPRQVAEEVLAAADLDGVATVELAGPGFLNLTLEAVFLGRLVADLAADERLGIPAARFPERVVVDYSAPNVAKEMHIGHLRTTVIGDALVRLCTAVGHDVVRENHIGDWGRPFGMLIEHLVDMGAEHDGSLGLGDLDAFYKNATTKFDHDDDFRGRARARVVALQQGDAETLGLWRALVAQSAEHWNDVYAKLGVLLTDDDLAGESRYDALLPEVLERLGAAGLLEESDGALVVFPPGFTNRDGDPLPLIVRSRAGAFTYATSDLACVIDRVERVQATLLLYVVGAEQGQHLAMVFAVSEMAGWLAPPARAEHVSFGLVLGTDRKRLRSRSGEPVRFVDVIDEAIERGTAAVEEKNPDLPAGLKSQVGWAIGIGALKYHDLSTDRARDYVFDWDRMLSFDGDTAPYLQYAHARICSIFRRAGIDRTAIAPAAVHLQAPQERALAMRVLGFGSAVVEAVERASPHRLTTYLYELASAFTAFYEHCPVLQAPDASTRASRLALSDVTARVLARGLHLLGIEAPDQM